jgi:hypothetical protein
MPSVAFELAIPTSERPQTYALDRAATGIDLSKFVFEKTFNKRWTCQSEDHAITKALLVKRGTSAVL